MQPGMMRITSQADLQTIHIQVQGSKIKFVIPKQRTE